jgi:hypothetical protein
MRSFGLILVTSITVGCGSGGGGPADGAAHDGPPDGRPTVDAAPPCEGWLREDVAQTSTTAFRLGLALDADGVPHITYHDDGSVWIATRGEGWSSETITSTGTLDPFSTTGIAYDASGRVHVVWSERRGTYYATRSGAAGAWTFETIEETDPVYTGAAMFGLAQDGTLHVAYDVVTQGVKHAERVGATWEQEWVVNDSDFQVRGLRVGVAEQVHLVMTETNAGEPWYATDGSGAWQVEVLDPTAAQGDADLAISPAGGLHVVYEHGTGDVRLITGTPGNWQVQILDMEGSLGIAIAVGFAPDGVFHAAYDIRDQAVVIGKGTAGAWSREVVDPVPRAVGTALTFGSDGTAHLAYYDIDRQMIRYARSCPP